MCVQSIWGAPFGWELENVIFQEHLTQIWDGFKIINADFNETFGGLWREYFATNASLWFNNEEYEGIEQIANFHDELAETLLGGYRFYVISLIANDGFVTIHLRGSIISSDLTRNYNDDFRMSIEYRLNENEEISSAIYHIDTSQFKEIQQEFMRN